MQYHGHFLLVSKSDTLFECGHFSEIWKINLSPDKETDIPIEPFITRAKRRALQRKLDDDNFTKQNKQIKMNENKISFVECPICEEKFQPQELPSHGQKCAEIFD